MGQWIGALEARTWMHPRRACFAWDGVMERAHLSSSTTPPVQAIECSAPFHRTPLARLRADALDLLKAGRIVS
jgi:hypothetical protein